MTLAQRLLALALSGTVAVGLVLFARAQMQPSVPNLSSSGRGVIFPASVASKFAKQCSRSDVVGDWTRAPSRAEVTTLEAALPLWMQTAPGLLSKSFNAYHYQYGALERDGERYVYVNAALAFNADDWEREPILMCDGGPNYWSVEWNVRTGQFHNDDFNNNPPT